MKICYYKMEEIDSTSTWAKRECKNFLTDHLTVITAEKQSHGKGRWGRTWVSPAGKNIYMTLAVPIKDPKIKVFCYSQAACLAIQTLLVEYGIKALIKWPNDLLVEGCKISGILTERQEPFVLIGIGLNVNMSQEELQAIPQKATSMVSLLGKSFDVEKVIKRLIELFVEILEKGESTHFTDVEKSWCEKVQWMLSERVKVETHTGKLEGHLVKLKADGAIVLQTVCGNTLDITSADIQIT